MFDLTNFLFKGHYYTFAISISSVNINARSIYERMRQIQTKHSDQLSIGYKLSNKKHSFLHYYKQEQMRVNRIYDLFIRAIFHQNNLFLICTVNHEKIDGSLLRIIYIQDIKELFSDRIQSAIYPSIRIQCGAIYAPIKISLVNKLSEKYKFSRNIIMQSIWSLYFSCKFKRSTFSHLISIRGESKANGNMLVIESYNVPNKLCLTDVCQTIQSNIQQAKTINRNSLTFAASLVKCVNTIYFVNWVSLVDENLGINGVFHESWFDYITSTYNFLPDILFIIKQNDSYALSPVFTMVEMWQTDMSDFGKFCQRII